VLRREAPREGGSDRRHPRRPLPEPTDTARPPDPYTLLVAVALSAQTTDKKVNQITPAVFAEAATMVELGPERILELIRELGLAPTKAKNLWLAATQHVVGGLRSWAQDILLPIHKLARAGPASAAVPPCAATTPR
jgi:HhH-GPD superfamily base excision DNA repair protein